MDTNGLHNIGHDPAGLLVRTTAFIKELGEEGNFVPVRDGGVGKIAAQRPRLLV